MILVFILASRSVVHNVIESFKEYLSGSNVEYWENKLEVDRQDEYYDRTECASINNECLHNTKTIDSGGIIMFVLMTQLIIQHVLYMIILMRMIIWIYLRFGVVRFIIDEASMCRFSKSTSRYMVVSVIAMIHSGNSQIDCLIDILSSFVVNKAILLICMKLESLLIFIMAILNQSYHILNTFYVYCGRFNYLQSLHSNNHGYLIDIGIANIIFSDNLNMGHFFVIVTSFIFNSDIKSNYINLQSIFTSIITILNVLLNIFFLLTKRFINYILSLTNDSRSHYKFIHLPCCTFSESTMTILSTNQLELMIYCAIKVTKSSRKYIDNIYDKNKPN